MVTWMSPAIELAVPGSWPAAKLGLVRPRPVAYRVSTSPGLAGAKVPPVNNPGVPTNTPVLAFTAVIGFWNEIEELRRRAPRGDTHGIASSFVRRSAAGHNLYGSGSWCGPLRSLEVDLGRCYRQDRSLGGAH